MNFTELLVSAKKGNKESITTLFIMYQNLIKKYSYIGSEFSEDLYQELSLSFLNSIKKIVI